jgi:glycosyltransferase involved in cell wall biosynthesis
MLSGKERGLSNSRNLALESAQGEICLLADDDIRYLEGYKELVLAAYERHPDADIICFKLATDKSYAKKPSRMGYLRSMRIMSDEISFKRQSLLEAGVRFNPLFGAGARYPSGEENILLFRCLDKGLRIYYEPVTIAALTEERESTWFKGYDEEFFKQKGAVFAELSRRFAFWLALQFAIRKRGLYKGSFSTKQVLGFMLEGIRELRKV